MLKGKQKKNSLVLAKNKQKIIFLFYCKQQDKNMNLFSLFLV